MKIAVIGFGAIGRFIVERLNEEPSVEVSAVFSLPRPELASVPVVDNIESLLATRPEPVVECAGHEGLRNSGEAVIRHGTDLLLSPSEPWRMPRLSAHFGTPRPMAAVAC